jgi:hypothetical protein
MRDNPDIARRMAEDLEKHKEGKGYRWASRCENADLERGREGGGCRL